MNNYSTIGRLTRDPETKYTTSGKSVTSFSLALDVGFGDRKKTIFWECKIWGERGETFAKYVFKGHQVGIAAEIDQEEWDDKTTSEKRKKLVLNVRDFTLLSNGEKRQESSNQGGRQQQRPAQQQRVPEPEQQDPGLDGEDIPF